MKLFITTLLAASLLTVPLYADPPDGPVDPGTSQWYRGLKQPGTGYSCCSIADCRATELRADPSNGTHWQALISKETFGPYAPDTWVTIPPETVLPGRDNPTGRVVICYYGKQIHCAVLPSLT